MFHLHPIYTTSCKSEEGIQTTNDKHVDCPQCLVLMAGLSDCRRKLVDDHAAAMYRVLTLPKNADKGSWEGIEPYDLLQLMKRELREFEAALWGVSHGTTTVSHLESEGADISAFAAMIVDVCRKHENKCKRPPGLSAHSDVMR